MNKSKKLDLPSTDQPIWDEKQIKKVTLWLKSQKGIKYIEDISKKTQNATLMFNDMIVVDPDQLKEPYTI